MATAPDLLLLFGIGAALLVLARAPRWLRARRTGKAAAARTPLPFVP